MVGYIHQSECDAQVAAIKARHEEHMAAMTATHDDQMAATKAAHDELLKYTRSAGAKEIARATDGHKNVTAQLSGILRATHDEQMAATKARHEEQMAATKAAHESSARTATAAHKKLQKQLEAALLSAKTELSALKAKETDEKAKKEAEIRATENSLREIQPVRFDPTTHWHHAEIPGDVCEYVATRAKMRAMYLAAGRQGNNEVPMARGAFLDMYMRLDPANNERSHELFQLAYRPHSSELLDALQRSIQQWLKAPSAELYERAVHRDFNALVISIVTMKDDPHFCKVCAKCFVPADKDKYECTCNE
jgi:hypothetical protein